MKYWAYVNNEILGPFEKEKLLELPSFAPSLLICPQTPVGEKTEDWKEASTYPEISAAIGSGTLQSAPAAAGNFGGPAIGAAQPSLSQTGQDFKSLTAASVDPVPPKESSLGGISLEVGHLERSGRIAPAQAGEPVHQSSSSFDPISLSSISRKADTLSGTELPPRSGADVIAKEPQQSFSSHSPEPVNVAAAGASPLQAAAAGAAGGAGLEELTRKVEALAQNMASRQDVAALADPLRMKLDQMGEVLSSMKNSQFQREIMDKLAYLENSVGEIKSGLKSGGGSPAHAVQPMVIERTSDTVFGAQPPASLEKSKPAPASASGRSTVILDQGKKSSKIGGMLGTVVKKFFKFVMTIALLAAVALVSVIGLKTAGVFDATKFIPFPLPFITKTAPAAEKAAEAVPQAPAQEQPAPDLKQEAPKEADISPEIVYFARNYTAAPGGARLEDKISEITAAAGGTYNPANWQTNKSGPDMYETAAVIPVKGGKITFTFIVDYAKKSLIPADPTGKAAFDALSKAGAAQGKKAGRQTKNRGPKKAEAGAAEESAGEPAATPPAKGKSKAAAPAAKGKGKAAAGKKAAAAKEEFEYVYEDEQ